MTDDELIQCFEAGTPPPGGFHHEQHVRAAWCYLRRHPRDLALERFRSGLRHFAEAQGAPNRYHETITTAFVLLIANRLGDLAADTTWAGFASRNADLLAWKPSILDRYYTPGTLASDRARQTFVPPDLGPEPGSGSRESSGPLPPHGVEQGDSRGSHRGLSGKRSV